MSKKVYYRQCRLSKPGYLDQVSWIPETFAEAGKIVKLKNEGTEDWANGWSVKSVGLTRLAETPHTEGLIRNHRNATGDSMPKKANVVVAE
jgi:hypothetical protein